MSSAGPIRLLLVEDEAKVAAALREGLEAEGYLVALENTGEGAFFRATTERYDLVLLDLTLPGRDGLDVLRALRAQRERTLVLVLTARDSLADRVAGLEGGADDYLVKPFAFTELLARVRALLRRSVGERLTLQVSDLSIDLITRTAVCSGSVLDLTQREFQLLEYLMRHEGQIVSRDSLTREIWNERTRSASRDNVIDVHMGRLRRKLDGAGRQPLLRTIRGVGYVLGDEGQPPT